MNNRKVLLFEKYQKIVEELSDNDIDAVMRGKTWAELMQLKADEFNTISLSAESESDVATKMDAAILEISSAIFAQSGLKEFELNKERTVSLKKEIAGDENSICLIKSKGRIDSKYASFLIEYKQPSKYKSKADTEGALFQALDYLNSLYEENPQNYLACITDGSKCQFIAFNDQIKAFYDIDKYLVTPLTAVNVLDAKAADTIFRGIINLQIKALTAENLKTDLIIEQHEGKSIIQHLTQALYESLHTMNQGTTVSYQQWMNNFGLSHDDISKQKAIEDRRKDLAELINKEEIETDEEYKILFSLQTAIAILAMLMAYRVVLIVKGTHSESFKNLLDMDTENRRIELKKIAEGSTSITMNIFNLLEISCFSWPFQKEYWTDETNACIRWLIETLMYYEAIPDLTEHTDDLFRDLYMSIMPVSVRHSLGEYYTPTWLAENVILSGEKYLPFDKKNIRVLDSTAGSGTFPQKVIEQKRNVYSSSGMGKHEMLCRILSEVVAIDANTLAVILARINYFLAIADLIDAQDEVYIPVFIGDSSVPRINKLSADKKYYIDYIQMGNGNRIDVKVPVTSLDNQIEFVNTLQGLALFNNVTNDTITIQLNKLCSNEMELQEIVPSWLELNNKGLINPATISALLNSFLLCSIGEFDLVVGNPPWVDWKSLPSVHRENKKEICYERNIFSGDGRTGGNSLNICALISNITAENWLASDGVMAILMPQSLLFQQSYEGYRELKILDGRKLYFQEIVDWSKAGHPFSPVKQLFCTYILSSTNQDYSKGIPLKKVELKKGFKLDEIKEKINKNSFLTYFSLVDGVVGKASESRSAFTYASTVDELNSFNLIAGSTDYVGREGVEYYPQELQLLTPISIDKKTNEVKLTNYQSVKSKISVGKQEVIIESSYLRPLVKGINISRFHVEPSEYVVAFPYDEQHSKLPLSECELLEKAPKLLRYYSANKDYLTVQTAYSDKIIGKKEAEYYALARTGYYCHAEWYVVFRDNTKWVASVCGKIDTKWGGEKIPAFQNHCVSICEDSKGRFITEDEAHYICAILNSHIVENYIMSTSDKRTFKIRVPVNIPTYDPSNIYHTKLSELSKIAHARYEEYEFLEKIRQEIDELYIELMNRSILPTKENEKH